MGSNIPLGYGLGSISPKYYVNHGEYPGKILTIQPNKKPYQIDEILDNNLDTKILVYEDRIKGWFLNFAKELIKEENSEFVVLMICMNYLEGNQQFREGRDSDGKSTKMLEKALKRIFSEDYVKEIGLLIEKVRHGLFHDGMTRRGAVLRYGEKGIPFFHFAVDNEDWIEINPALFFMKIEKDFISYINILKDKNNQEEREAFERYYNERYEKEIVKDNKIK